MRSVVPHNESTNGRGGALLLISVLMIGSAIIRFAMEAGPALAREISEQTETPELSVNPENETGDEELRLLLREFSRRETELERRERIYQDRMKALEVADKAIEKRLRALIEAEEKLRQTLAFAESASENDLTRLTSVYENMKPKEAAALFEEMDPTFAAGFLARMAPENAAGVMAGLSPQAAYTISVVLAGRNAAVPKE